MLQNCLQLNPYFRMTANECLNAKLFDSVRDPVKERILLSLKQKKNASTLNSKENPCQVRLSVDAADAFDYEKPENAKYSIDQIKGMLAKSIVGFTKGP